MASPNQVILSVVEQSPEPLTRSEIFSRAGLAETDQTISIFAILKEQGKIEHIGKGRGTRYQLAGSNPVVSTKAEYPDYSKEILEFSDRHQTYTFRELMESFPEGTHSHNVRLSLNTLIEKKIIFTIGERSDRHYSSQQHIADIIEIANEDEKVLPIINIIWPFIEVKKIGIVTSDISEKFPDLSRSSIYLALNYLLDTGKIEAFGERRGRTYSVAGEGEINHEVILNTEAQSVKPRVVEFLKKIKAARPLVIQQQLMVDRSLLNIAIEELVHEKIVYETGERRGKIIALAGVGTDTVEQARESQQSVHTSVDKFSSKLANPNLLAIAIVQRLGASPFKLMHYDTNVSKTVEDTFHSYKEVQQWFINGVNADVREFDRLSQETSNDTGRSRRRTK